MFRFVYAVSSSETSEPEPEADGWAGIESDVAPATLPWTGTRGPAVTGVAYTVVPPLTQPAVASGRGLRDAAERQAGMLMVEQGGAFVSAHDLWLLMEATRHPRVKVAVDIDAATAAGQTAAVLVPTLNLRIGLVRVRTATDAVTAYARRLAGIGFNGYVVLDPAATADRPAVARAMAELCRSIFPAKPTKKSPAKAAG